MRPSVLLSEMIVNLIGHGSQLEVAYYYFAKPSAHGFAWPRHLWKYICIMREYGEAKFRGWPYLVGAFFFVQIDLLLLNFNSCADFQTNSNKVESYLSSSIIHI